MNITLSASADLITESRRFARENGTSLNQLVRDYLESLVHKGDAKERRQALSAADEFRKLALCHSTRSPDGYRFRREDAHGRESLRQWQEA